MLISGFNPFAPEPPLTARAKPRQLYRLWRHQFQRSRTTLTDNLSTRKRYFEPYPNQHDSVKPCKETSKKPCNFDSKISMKILLHYPPRPCSKQFHDPRRFCENVSHRTKAYQIPSKVNKKRGEKNERSGEERERKVKVEGARKLFN